METSHGVPFVLRFAERVIPTVTPGEYDREKQLWIAPVTLAAANTLRTSEAERTDEIDQGPGV